MRVYPIAETQSLGKDVALHSLSLPAGSPAGKAARAEVWLRSDNPTTVSGRLLVRQGTKMLVRDEVKVPPGDSVITRPILFKGEGLLEFIAEFQPTDPATDLDRATTSPRRGSPSVADGGSCWSGTMRATTETSRPRSSNAVFA